MTHIPCSHPISDCFCEVSDSQNIHSINLKMKCIILTSILHKSSQMSNRIICYNNSYKKWTLNIYYNKVYTRSFLIYVLSRCTMYIVFIWNVLHLNSRDRVSSGVVMWVRSSPYITCTHTIVVILTRKHTWRLKQCCQVERFEYLSR